MKTLIALMMVLFFFTSCESSIVTEEKETQNVTTENGIPNYASDITDHSDDEDDNDE